MVRDRFILEMAVVLVQLARQAGIDTLNLREELRRYGMEMMSDAEWRATLDTPTEGETETDQ